MNYVFLWLTPPNLGDNQLIGDTRATSSLSGTTLTFNWINYGLVKPLLLKNHAS